MIYLITNDNTIKILNSCIDKLEYKEIGDKKNKIYKKGSL